MHEHHARHLHWDFRLELPERAPEKVTDPLEGTGSWVLKSWAIPKGPPMEPGVKRLAVEVEDHLLDYIDFQGTIPEGEYGAGAVYIWDSGQFELVERAADRIEFILKGEKLEGLYILLRFKRAGNKNWLLFKSKD
ncbi:MAG: DNA polymerase ligase N-terminal domain-containing protein [Actinomycetota bacterium]